MTQNERAKICLVGESLAGGGAEKAMAVLSQFFDTKGIDVHSVLVIDQVDYDYSGALLNLGKLKNKANGPLNKLRRFIALRNYLRKHRFDYIIDFRIRVSFVQEYFISKWLYNAPAIYTVHSAMTDLYFPERKWQARAVYKNAFAIIAVSEGIENIIRQKYGLHNTKVIHNAIDLRAIGQSADQFTPGESRYILAAGRMKDGVKQFGKLIEAYSQTSLPQKDIKLVILGDGQRRRQLEDRAVKIGMSDSVVFKGRLANPFPYMKNALFFVLSSKREGLPTVILESLACGSPVVAFDCVSGPSEMISDRKSGLLVADQDFEKLKDAIELMVSDEQLYEDCRKNAKAAASSFSVANIGRQWLEFLKID